MKEETLGDPEGFEPLSCFLVAFFFCGPEVDVSSIAVSECSNQRLDAN